MTKRKSLTREIAEMVAPDAFSVTPSMYGLTGTTWQGTMGWAAQEVAKDKARALSQSPQEDV